MRAWVVERPGPIDSGPLALRERPVPEPAPTEVRVRVSVCGVCRTDLHVAEGDLPAHRGVGAGGGGGVGGVAGGGGGGGGGGGVEGGGVGGVVPGHEVVGVVDAVGDRAARFSVGDRIGIAWL